MSLKVGMGGSRQRVTHINWTIWRYVPSLVVSWLKLNQINFKLKLVINQYIKLVKRIPSMCGGARKHYINISFSYVQDVMISHIPFTKMKYLFSYINSFPIARTRIKRFTCDSTCFVGKCCNVGQTHGATDIWRPNTSK